MNNKTVLAAKPDEFVCTGQYRDREERKCRGSSGFAGGGGGQKKVTDYGELVELVVDMELCFGCGALLHSFEKWPRLVPIFSVPLTYPYDE